MLSALVAAMGMATLGAVPIALSALCCFLGVFTGGLRKLLWLGWPRSLGIGGGENEDRLLDDLSLDGLSLKLEGIRRSRSRPRSCSRSRSRYRSRLSSLTVRLREGARPVLERLDGAYLSGSRLCL